MRSLNSTVAGLVARSPLTVIPFVRITLRDGTTLRYSDTEFEYLGDPYGPYLVRPAPRTEAMNHLPTDSFGQLYRNFSFQLRNDEVDALTGRKLWPSIRDEIQFAAVEFGELFLDAFASVDEASLNESDRLQLLQNTDNEEIRFRGYVDSYGPITRESVPLNCTSFVPTGGVNSITIGDATERDQQRRPAVPYGAPNRVPLVALNAGLSTTLATEMGPSATSLSVSDATGFDVSGTVYVSGERMDYSGLTGNTLTGVVRAIADVSVYPTGTPVVFVPPSISYAVSVAEGVSRVRSTWMRSPNTGELFRFGSIGEFVPDNGSGLATLNWTKASFLSVIDSTVIAPGVSQQPNFDSGTGSTLSDEWVYTGATRVVQSGDEGWTSPGKADGTWAGLTFTFADDRRDRKIVIQPGTIGTPTPGNRQVVRARLRVRFNVVDIVANVVTITFQNEDIGAGSSGLLGQLDDVWNEPITAGAGAYEFFGEWKDGDPVPLTDLEQQEVDIWFRTDPDDDTSQLVVTVTGVALEYEYVDVASDIQQTAPALVQALGSGAPVEMFADLDGPTIPPAAYDPGYGFPSGETWSENDVTVSDVTGGVQFASDAVWTTRLDLNGDAASLSRNGQPISALSDANNPNGNPSLLQTVEVATNLISLDGDVANWSGPYVSSATGGINFDPPASAITFTERNLDASPEDWNGYQLGVQFFAIGINVDAVLIRIYDGTAYQEFRWPNPISNRTLWFDLKDPTNDPLYNATSGTPNLAQASKVGLGLDNPASAGFHFVENVQFWTGRQLAGDLAGAVWSLASENWTGRERLRVGAYVANDSSSTELSHLQLRIGNATNYSLFRFFVGDLAKGAENNLEVSLQDPASDPNHVFDVGTGFDPLDVDFVVMESAVLDTMNGAATGYADQLVYWRNIETRDAIGTDLNAQVAPAVSPDLSGADKRYRLTFQIDNPSTFGEVEIQFSNESPVYPAGPTAYRVIRFSSLAFPSGETVVAEFVASEVGSPTNLNDVNVIRIRMLDETDGGGVVTLFDLEVSDQSVVYAGATGGLIELPVDVVRHFLTVRSDIQGATIDETSFAFAATALAVQRVGVDLASLGVDDSSALQALGFQHRFQLVQREANASTEYQMLSAEADLTWPAPVLTLAAGEWGNTIEDSQDGGAIVNHRRFFYAYDAGDGLYTRTLRVDSGQSDLDPVVTAAELGDSESQIGTRFAQDVVFRIDDEATAKDSASFYTREELRLPRVFSLSGVPFLEGYAIERGDVISWEDEDEVGSFISARVIAVTHDSIAAQVELTAVSVETEPS